MIPLCSRFDSVLFIPKMSAIASYGNFSRSPLYGRMAGALAELLDQGEAAGDSIEDKLRRIVKEMPHITSTDIQQVCSVRVEMARQDASVLMADAEACKQIKKIIEETQQISGRPHLNTGEAIQILCVRAEQGDKHASELLDEFSAAALVVNVSE